MPRFTYLNLQADVRRYYNYLRRDFIPGYETILSSSLLSMADLISMAMRRPVETGLPYVQIEYSEPVPNGLVPATILPEISKTVNPVFG